MPWWNRKSAVSPSSSSSSPSSAASSPGGSDIFGRRRSRDLHFPWRLRPSTQPRIVRPGEPRHLSDNVDGALFFDSAAAAAACSAGSTPVSRSPSNLDCHPGRSSSSLVLLPQPLPLPDLLAAAASPQSASASGLGLPSPISVCCPLPSPRDHSSKSEGDDANPSAAEASSVMEPVSERASSAGAAGRIKLALESHPHFDKVALVDWISLFTKKYALYPSKWSTII